MRSVDAAVAAGAGVRDALLVAGELDELAELVAGERLQHAPEELHVRVALHQTHLVHGVRLQHHMTSCTSTWQWHTTSVIRDLFEPRTPKFSR